MAYLFAYIASLVFTARFVLRFAGVGPNAPLASIVSKITRPICRPIAGLFPKRYHYDMPALFIAWIIWVGYLLAIGQGARIVMGAMGGALSTASMSAGPGAFLMQIVAFLGVPILMILKAATNIFFYAIVFYVIYSFIAMNANNNHLTDIARYTVQPVAALVLAPLQRFIPPLGAFDLSPAIAIALLAFVERTLDSIILRATTALF